jgi:hypothetical protein
MKTRFLVLLIIPLIIGCIAHQTEMGRRIDPGQVGQIVEGKTTEGEVVALLGPPEQVMDLSDGKKILMYSHHLTQLYGRPGLARTKGGVSHEMLMIGLRDGIVKKKWQSASNTPMTSTTGQTFSVPDQFK